MGNNSKKKNPHKPRKITEEKRASILRKDLLRDTPTLPDVVVYCPIVAVDNAK